MTRKKRGKCCKFLPCCSDTESEVTEDFEDTTLARGRVLLKRYEESHPPHRSSVPDTETVIEEINITQRSPVNASADGILDITPELNSGSSEHYRDQSDDTTDGTKGNDGYSKDRKHHSVPAEIEIVARHVKSPHSTQPLQVGSGRVDLDVKVKKRHSVPEYKAQKVSREAIRTPHGIQPIQIKKRHDESDARVKDRQIVPADKVEKTREVIERPDSAQKKHDISATEDDLMTRHDVKTPFSNRQEEVSSGNIDAHAGVRRSPSIQDVDTKHASRDSYKTLLGSQESVKVIKGQSISEEQNIQDVDKNLPSPHATVSAEVSSGSDTSVQIKKKVTGDDTDAKLKKRHSKPEDKAKTSDTIKEPHEFKESKVISGNDGSDTKIRKQTNINEDKIKVSRDDIAISEDFQLVQVPSENVDLKVKKHIDPSVNGEGVSPPLPVSEDHQMVKHDTHPPDKPVIHAVEDEKDIFDTDTEMEKHECVATEDRAVAATGAQTSQHISEHFEIVTEKLRAEDNAVKQVSSAEAQATAAIADLHRPYSHPVVSVRDMQAAEHDHFEVKAAGGTPKVKKDKLRFVKRSVHSENDLSDTLHLMSREEEVHFLTLDTESELEERECMAQKKKSKIPVRVKVPNKSEGATEHSSRSTTKHSAHQSISSTKLPIPQSKSTAKHPAPPSPATTKTSTSNTKQSSSTTKQSDDQGKSTPKQPSSTTKQYDDQGKSYPKQPSSPDTSVTMDSVPQSKSVTKLSTSATKQSSPPNTSTTKQPSPPKTSTTKQPSPPKTATTKKPAPPPVPPSGPVRKPRVSRASKAKLPDDKFKFMKKDEALPSPPDSDESISLKPANTRMKIPELFVDENAAAQKQESSGSDTDPDFYRMIGLDFDKARALKHAADRNPLRVISSKSEVIGVFIDSSDSSLRATTSGSSTDPELYKLIDFNKKSDTSDEEFNNRPSCRLDSSLKSPIPGPNPSLTETQQPLMKKIGASHTPKEVSAKRSKISSTALSGKNSSSTEDSMSSDSRRSKAKLGHTISKKDTGLGKVPSMSKRSDISGSKLPIQLGAHPVVLNPIGSSSATPTDVHALKGHKKGSLSQASANFQVARRLDFSPPTASSSDLSSPSDEPDKLQHRKVPTKRVPTAIFSESPSSSDSFEQQFEILQGPTTSLSRPPSATELPVPSTLCISGAVSVIGYEKEIDLRERQAEISTSSLPAHLPSLDLLAPSPFMRKTGQPLPPVMGKSSSSCQEPQVTTELQTKNQIKMKQDSLTLMGSKGKRPKPTEDIWFKQDETTHKDMLLMPDQTDTKEVKFKHDQRDSKEVRFKLDPTTSKEFQIKQDSLSKKDKTVRNDLSSHREVRFSPDSSSTLPRQDHAGVGEALVRKDTPSDQSPHRRELRLRKERFDPLSKDSTTKRDSLTTKEVRFRQDLPAKNSLRQDPSTSKGTRFKQDHEPKNSGPRQDFTNAKEMRFSCDPQSLGPRMDTSDAQEKRLRQMLPTKDSQLILDPASSNKARFREDPPVSNSELRLDLATAQEMRFRQDTPAKDTELRLDPFTEQEMSSRQDPQPTRSSFKQDSSSAQEMRPRQDPRATSSSLKQDPATAKEKRSRHDPPATSSSPRQDPATAKEMRFRQNPPATSSSTRQDPSSAPEMRFRQNPPATSSSFKQDPTTAQEMRSRHDPPASSSRQDSSSAQEMRSRQDPPATSFKHDPSSAQEKRSRHDPPATSSSFKQDPSASKHVQFKGIPASKHVQFKEDITTSNTQAPWLRRAQADPQSAVTSRQLRANSTGVRLTRRARVEKPALPPPRSSQTKKGNFPHVSKH